MRMTTLFAVSLLMVGATASTATAFIDNEGRTMYDLGFEADGRGYAGIFFSMPVETDGVGHIEMVDNGASRMIRTNSPIDVVATFNGNQVESGVTLDADWVRWNGESWDVDVNLAESEINGLKELELSGTMIEQRDGTFSLALSGFAVYNMQRVDLSLSGDLTLSEFTGVRAL